MEIVKPDLSRFDSIKDFPYQAQYLDFEFNGSLLKMHYIDEGVDDKAIDQQEVILALHGEPSWSYLYRKFIPVLNKHRFIAPDLIGFGKSDKIVDWKDYSFELHFQSLVHFIEKLDLTDITLVVQDWGGILGLSLLGEFPERFKQVVIMNTFLPVGKPLKPFFKLWQKFARYHPSLPIGLIMQMGTHNKLAPDVVAAYKAPFPNKKHKGGAKSFPVLVPGKTSDEGVARIKKAREVLSKWEKPCLVLFSDKDSILGGLEKFFYKLVPSSSQQQKIMIHNAGHFLQEEKGEEIAGYIDQFMKGELLKK